MLLAIIFTIFAAIIIISASMVVFSQNIVYSAFSLLFTFFGIAGLYVLLAADFLAATQLLIYVGGILVLLLFGVMLTHKIHEINLSNESMRLAPAAIVVLSFLGLLSIVVYRTQWPTVPVPELTPTTARIGTLFMTDYLLPFEIASLVLLTALVGAVFMARGRVEK
jgi:NADH-quinone oxidoreductase subunit J